MFDQDTTQNGAADMGAMSSSAQSMPMNDTGAVQTMGDIAAGYSQPSSTPADDVPSAAVPSDHATAATEPADNDLLALKQDALNSLSPLVGQLDQSPEEKFRTTMMMIQASDDHSLLKVAYEAAQAIADEKERAQALLDVINEINYFTSHDSHQA